MEKYGVSIWCYFDVLDFGVIKIFDLFVMEFYVDGVFFEMIKKLV